MFLLEPAGAATKACATFIKVVCTSTTTHAQRQDCSRYIITAENDVPDTVHALESPCRLSSWLTK